MNRSFGIMIALLLVVLVAGFLYSGIQKATIHQEQFPPMVNDTSPLMTSQAHQANSLPVSILFIGNSFTNFNNMPKKLVALADADADSPLQLTVQMVARGGVDLTREYEDMKAPGQVIQSRKWDYVVLQDHSFWAMTPELVIQTTTIMRNFDAMIREDGAQTVIFLTWANQRDSSWYKDAQFSFTRDPEYMQQQFDEKTYAVARMLHAGVVPAGDYWAAALAARPALPLFEPDGHHPSPTGAYLNALAFYHHLTGRSVAQIAYLPAGVNEEDADFLRKMVSATAVDGQSGGP